MTGEVVERPLIAEAVERIITNARLEAIARKHKERRDGKSDLPPFPVEPDR